MADVDPPAAAEVDAPSMRGRRPWLGVLLFVVGILLLGAAVTVALRRGELPVAVESLRRAPWWVIGGVLLLPLVNWLLTSGVFSVLTRRFGPVGWGEMSGLVASAWLLNLLPLRPGMLGRVAYHKTVHGVRVRDSAVVLLLAMICTAAAAAALVATVVLAGRLGLATAGSRVPVGFGALVAAPMGLAVAASVALRCREGRWPLAWRVVVAGALRYADVLVWTARYALVFDLAGQPVDLRQAAIVAAASQAAMAVPIQVGVREWIVGLAGAAVAGQLGGGSAVNAAAPGVAADLLNRGAELAVLLPLGLGSTLWLWGLRSTRTARAAGDAGRD